MTKIFYESGYNALPWTTSLQASTDIFYFDLPSLPESADLLTELKIAAPKIFKSHSVLLDDGSLEAEILKLLIPSNSDTKVQNWPLDFPIDTVNSERWIKKRLMDPESHLLLQYAKYLKKPLIAPRAMLRVINANWSYSESKCHGRPYWVYTENERHHCMQLILQHEQLDIETNLLKCSPRVYRAYFMQPKLLNFFLTTENVPDNYLIERNILHDIYKNLGGHGPTNLHKKHWPVPDRLHGLLPSIDVQQACFPIHHFYKKYMKHDLPVNLFESEIYGPIV